MFADQVKNIAVNDLERHPQLCRILKVPQGEVGSFQPLLSKIGQQAPAIIGPCEASSISEAGHFSSRPPHWRAPDRHGQCVHYPGDVVLGSIVGAGTSAMVAAACDRAYRSPRREGVVPGRLL